MTTATTEARIHLENFEQMGTKDEARAKIKDAEIALAHASVAVFQAVASGEVKPCACHYARLGCAQDDLEKLSNGLDGHESKRKSDGSSDIMEALMRMASR